MFAVVKTGGKQYKVARDSIIKVEKIEGQLGSKIELDQVLMLGESSKASFILFYPSEERSQNRAKGKPLFCFRVLNPGGNLGKNLTLYQSDFD